jgi:hypothetical protein
VKVFLMHPDRDFDIDAALPDNQLALAADLGLGTLLNVMSGNDAFLLNAATHGLLASLASPADITYRQHVLADCVAQPAVIRDLYDLAVETVDAERGISGFLFGDSPETILDRSRQLMQLQLASLRRLADTARREAANFRSDGFTRLFAMLVAELDDAYLAEVQAHLVELAFRHGALVSAKLGSGNKGTGYVLRRRPAGRGLRDLLPGRGRAGYSFTIADRDEAGFRALSELASRGVSDTANAVAQATDHVRSFFAQLRAELGFCIGCLSLRDRLLAAGMPVCYPVPSGTGGNRLTARCLYDAGLALDEGGRVVGNDLAADGRQLIMITGANQGGKSTFLRAVGQAQLMMQAGMFTAAEAFCASSCSGVFTHFKREEDATMEHGKLDEELDRMRAITDRVKAGALLLCNESFASTDEREGSQIAREIIRALNEAGVRIVFVTHMYDLAESIYAKGDTRALFLRAQRQHDGSRTYRLPEGPPLPTSYGEDLYRRILGPAHEAAPV